MIMFLLIALGNKLTTTTKFQEVVARMKSGEGGVMQDLPNPELFECSICGVSVKYKKEHLAKTHQVH